MPAFRNARIVTLNLHDGSWSVDTVDFGDQLFQERTVDSPQPPRSTRGITHSELDALREELNSADFWNAVPIREDREVDDGWAMAVEGRSGDRYRVVTRINLLDGYERVACAFFLAARMSYPEALRCPSPIALPRSEPSPME
jgi:hypothetical protein